MVLLATAIVIFGFSTAHLSVNFKNALNILARGMGVNKSQGISVISFFGLSTSSFTYLMNK